MRIDLPIPAIVIRAVLDLHTRRKTDEGLDEHPYVGSLVVQWEEVDASAPTRIVHEIPVWTSKPYWDAPGYASDEAENAARQEAVEVLAEALRGLCRRSYPAPEGG